jgi:hypothetical protein
MDSRRWGPTLEDTLTPKYLHAQTFLPMKKKGKHITKVASSSTGQTTLIEELPAWKLGKIHTP